MEDFQRMGCILYSIPIGFSLIIFTTLLANTTFTNLNQVCLSEKEKEGRKFLVMLGTLFLSLGLIILTAEKIIFYLYTL